MIRWHDEQRQPGAPRPGRPSNMGRLVACAVGGLLLAVQGAGPASAAAGPAVALGSVPAGPVVAVAATGASVAGTPALGPGAQGAEVEALESRLSDLGYWVNQIDGVYDQDTRHAVVAFQKLHGLPRTGMVDGATQAALDGAGRPAARTGAAHGVEVDLTHQVLLVVDGGAVTAVFDTSTGRKRGTTPVGSFAVGRQIDGYRRSRLGLLYRPKYFHNGVAIHGYTSVPATPASHGCVRVTNAAMDHIWADGLIPVGTPVVVYR